MMDKVDAAIGRWRIHRDSTDCGRHRVGAANVQLATDLRILADAYSADHPIDEYEPVDPDWLLACGFTGGNDEPDVDVYQLRSGGLSVQVVIRFRSGEIVGASLALTWDYVGPPQVGLSYGIDDDPDRGDVRRLCAALQIPLQS